MIAFFVNSWKESVSLSLTYWVRLKGSVHNPSISVLSDCWEYTKKANGFGRNIDNLGNEYGLKELKYGPALAFKLYSCSLIKR